MLRTHSKVTYLFDGSAVGMVRASWIVKHGPGIKYVERPINSFSHDCQ